MMNKFLKYCAEGHAEGIRECLAYVDVDSSNKNGEAGLHLVSLNGSAECTRILIAAGASLDVRNSNGDTPLHVALMSDNENIALLLIQAGADTDSLNLILDVQLTDNEETAYLYLLSSWSIIVGIMLSRIISFKVGDSPIHIASSKGYTNVVRALCELGCVLDFPNDEGLYPVHLAAKNGHIDVVRYLCLYGCNVEQRNLKGIKAEIKAFKNGHYAVGELLNKLRIRSYRESYINQLMPTDKLLAKCNVKFLGCAATGKSTLISSLKASYFESLFARTKVQNIQIFNGRHSRGSPTIMQIEMNFTSRRASSNSLLDHEYTEGIKIHEASFGSGDVNLWEFSGLETYYFIYDYFLGDSSSFYVIVFDSSLQAAKQYYQCSFWLTFLQSRVQTFDKLYIRILLVGTHADLSVPKDAQGIYLDDSIQEMRNRLAQEFPAFTIEKKIILCNAQLPSSYEIREIKNIVADKKVLILQDMVKSTKFLELTIQYLKTWRKEFEVFPVITLETFVNKIHRSVNPLAGSEYISELITQLTVMGEIFYLKSKSCTKEHIILDIDWLCYEVLGVLLSLDTIAKVRITGCFTEEDFQGCIPQGPADKMLDLLSTLQICTQCENDGEIEFEFPCYNFVEKLDGLWTAADKRYSSSNGCYGGIRLTAPFNMLQTVFNRLQVQLRREIVEYQDPDIDLYQWFHGSKICLGDIESLISLEENGGAIEVKVRGTNLLRMKCFYFLNEILNIIKKVLQLVAPGLLCERHILSSEDLSNYADSPYSWSPEHFFSALLSSDAMNTTFWNPDTKQNESLLLLIGFGCEKVRDRIILGTDLPINELSEHCLQALAQLLDPPDPLGKDWCLLAVKLDLSHKIAAIDNCYNFSKTLTLIDIWRKTKEATIGNFVKKLLGFGREDAAKLVMRSAPLYKALRSREIERIYKTAPLDNIAHLSR